MSDYLKKPLSQSLNDIATRRAQQAIQSTGRALPCIVKSVVSSGIVTVSFDVNAAPFTLPNVTMPVQAFEYIRYPIKAGDRGVTVPAAVRLGYAAGLGGGVPDLSAPANLAGLAFAPLGSKAWSATDDPDAVVIYGPNGAILRDTASTHKITVSTAHVDLDGNILIDKDKAGFFGTSPVLKQAITGALSAVTDAAAKAVLASIIQALTTEGLTDNNTT